MARAAATVSKAQVLALIDQHHRNSLASFGDYAKGAVTLAPPDADGVVEVVSWTWANRVPGSDGVFGLLVVGLGDVKAEVNGETRMLSPGDSFVVSVPEEASVKCEAEAAGPVPACVLTIALTQKRPAPPERGGRLVRVRIPIRDPKTREILSVEEREVV